MVFVAGPLAAQHPGDPLAAIVGEALQRNLGLAQKDLLVARAEASVRETRSRFLPTLSIDARYSEPAGVVEQLPFFKRHESRLRLAQPIFEPSILAGHAAARHGRNAQRLERRTAARGLAAEAQTAFLVAGAARTARRTWEATLELVQESERVAQRLVDEGNGTPDQVLRARADAGEVRQNLDEARQTEASAARAFNRILRRPLDTPLEELPDSLLRFEIRLSEDEALAGALARREELAATDAAVRAADASVRLASAPFLPSVVLAADYGLQGSDLRVSGEDDYTMLSLVLSWNLFSGGRDVARRAAARADADRLRLRRAELDDLIRLEVRQAFDAAIVAREAIATAELRLAAARRSFELVRRRYREGVATHVEYLDARTAFTSAELNRSATIYRYAIRYVELERAAALRDLT